MVWELSEPYKESSCQEADIHYLCKHSHKPALYDAVMPVIYRPCELLEADGEK